MNDRKLLRVARAARGYVFSKDIYEGAIEDREMDLDRQLLALWASEKELRLAIAEWTGIPDVQLENERAMEEALADQESGA